MDIRIGYTIYVYNQEGNRATTPISGIVTFADQQSLDIIAVALRLVTGKRDKMRPGVSWEMHWQAVMIITGEPQRRSSGILDKKAMATIVQKAETALRAS